MALVARAADVEQEYVARRRCKERLLSDRNCRNWEAVWKLYEETYTGAYATTPGCTWKCEDGCYTSPAEVVTFLDWDDTIFPNTEFFHRWGLCRLATMRGEKVTENLSEEQEQRLEEWRVAAEKFLREVCRRSEHVVMVTNSSRTWVHRCIKSFAPNLAPLFDLEAANAADDIAVRSSSSSPRIHVVYALECLDPATYQKLTSDDTHRDVRFQLLTWAKFLAMQKEVSTFYSRYPGQTWKNVISVGDMFYERDAATWVADQRRKNPWRLPHETLRLKTLYTPMKPEIVDLTYTLRVQALLWQSFVTFDGMIGVNMNSAERLQNIADAFTLSKLDMPELRSMLYATVVGVSKEEVEESLLDVEDLVESVLEGDDEDE